MSKETTLVSVLSTATGVSVYGGEKRSTDNHCLTYKLFSSLPYRTQSGKTNVSKDAFLINCYGATYDEAKSLSETVFNTLEANTSDFILSIVDDKKDEPAQLDVNLYVRQIKIFVW